MKSKSSTCCQHRPTAHWYRNNSGFAVMGIVIALVGIMSIVMYFAMSRPPSDSLLYLNNSKGNLKQVADRIVNLVEGSDGWERTISIGSNSSIFDCLGDNGTLCPHSSAAPLDANTMMNAPNSDFEVPGYPIVLRIIDVDGSVFLDGMAGTAGYTDQGARCNTFSAVTANGDPNCPAQFRLRYQFLCPSGASCKNPEVRFVLLLYYNPGPAKRSHQIINPNNLRRIFTRGTKGPLKNQSFSAYYSNGAGGGPCTPGAFVRIPLNSLFEVTDPSNPTLIGGGQLVLKPGRYSCTAYTTCFDCGTIAIGLSNDSSGSMIATSPKALVSRWTQGRAELDQVPFTLNGVSRISIQHFCSANPTPSTFGMGIPVGFSATYDPSLYRFAEIRCKLLF